MHTASLCTGSSRARPTGPGFCRFSVIRDFPMLSLVDSYGDTFFSSLQMRAVIPELHRLKKLTPNPPLVLDEIRDLADECAEGIHAFLVFVGD